MRKYIIGGLVGAALTFSAGAFADGISMIGKTVQGETNVIVDTYTLDHKAIAIDGVTYVPVRELGEATGYNVTYNEGGVNLVKKGVFDMGLKYRQPQSTTPTPTPTPTATPDPSSTPDPSESTGSQSQQNPIITQLEGMGVDIPAAERKQLELDQLGREKAELMAQQANILANKFTPESKALYDSLGQQIVEKQKEIDARKAQP